MGTVKRRPIQPPKPTDSEIVRRRILAAKAWQEREWKEGRPGRLEDLGEKIEYCQGSKSAISDLIHHDDKSVHYEVVQRFAEETGCRYKYLTLVDDFMTEELLWRAGGETRTQAIETHIKLLEILGYDLEPQLYLHARPKADETGKLTPSINPKNWKKIKPTLTEEGLDNTIGEINLRDWDGNFPDECYPSLCVPVRRTLDDSQTAGYANRDYVANDGQIRYVLVYKVYDHGNLVATTSMNKLEKVFDAIDKYAKFTASIELPKYDNPLGNGGISYVIG